ncbi:MAG: zinc ribbon domain-containing protein [Firmicutes bacterium]|nr:zinc ribbon domain-containing protein [Bacillota bacterium]
MQIDVQDFKIQVDEIPVSEDVAGQLDAFCTALTEMKASGQSPACDPILGGLVALATLLQRKGAAGSPTNWTAKLTKASFGSGGGIALENQSSRQHLSVSVDHKGAFYSGTWARYVSDANVEGALFEIKENPEGYVFEVMDGAVTRTTMLGSNLGEIAWTSTVEEVRPDWLATQPAVRQPKPSHEPGAEIIMPTAGASPPKPEQDALKTEGSAGRATDASVFEDSGGKVCPGCGGQVKKSAKFCPACGIKLSSERPVEPLTGEENVPKAQKLCRKCGSPLGPAARFCNHCGTSV